MLEIVNRTRSPVQIMVRSRVTKSFATKIVPGLGSGKNKVYIEDEVVTDQLKILEKNKLISVNTIHNTDLKSREN